MVNSVSGVAPQNNQVRAMDKVSQEQLYAPGMYAMEELMEPPAYREKRGSFLGFLGKLVLTAAVVGGGAALLRNHALKDFDITAKPTKISEYAKKWTAQLGDFVNEKIVAKLKNIFSKKTEGGETPKGEAAPDEPKK